MKKLSTCDQCHGIGRIFSAVGTYSVVCDFCEGSGQSEKNLFWSVIGAQLKNARLEREITLRSAARQYNVDPSNLSKWERGILKPDPTYARAILNLN